MSSVSQSVRKIETSPALIDQVIRMAWHDRTSFETIEAKTGLREDDVICLMRRNLKARSFRIWRERVSARVTKHRALFEKRVKRQRNSRY